MSLAPSVEIQSDKRPWSRTALLLAGVILLIGAALRVMPYKANRSLWRDESSVSFNIITKDFGDLLFKPLDYNQAAPVGFLAVEKLAVMAFGNGERALRLFPLLAALAALPLMLFLARRALDVRGTLVALSLFALSQPLIYYASEVKQFGVDAMWVLAILLAALRYSQDGRKSRDLLALAIVGFIAIWFSHPAIFVLAGAGLTLFVLAWREKDRASAGSLVAAGAAWVIAFAVNWWFFLRMVSSHPYLKEYWHARVKAFPPMPTSWANLDWYVTTFHEMWANPIGLPAAGLAAAACIIGAIWLWRANRTLLALLALPILLVIGAAIVQQYPFQDRMILFLSPMLLILIAGGVAAIWRGVGTWRLPLGMTILIILLIQPAFAGVRGFVQPPLREEFRPVIAKVAPRIQQGDTVYLYEGAIRAFHYYTRADEKYALPDGVQLVEGIDEGRPWEEYQKDLDPLRGRKRVWVLFTHIHEWSGVDERKLYLYLLDQMGTQVEKYEARAAGGYLYDLSGE